MSEPPRTGNPFFDAWLDASRRAWQTPAPAGEMMAGAAEAVQSADENWKLYQRQVEDWIKSVQRWTGPRGVSETAEGVADETLRRMLDPSRFLFSGTDEINQAIQRLVEGPELADIFTLERQVLRATREWIALREASTAYRGATAAAWSRAFGTFSKEIAADSSVMKQGTRAVVDRWLKIANEELIRTQRTEEFLAAQRKLLSAGVAYRLKQRELVEVWCETNSIPTRTELDDLHRTVHELRHQVRSLQRQLAEAQPPKSAAGSSRRSAPKAEPARRPASKPAPKRRAAAKKG